jgi:hypothetical protein
VLGYCLYTFFDMLSCESVEVFVCLF